MSNPFAILAEYPEAGPEVPQREKVRREKNKHESGTGRRDREKRQGRGQSNWGNALDDINRRPIEEAQEGAEGEAPAQPEEPKIQYVAAGQFFSDSDDDFTGGVPERPTKQVVQIPAAYADIIAEKRDKRVEVRKYDSDDEEEIQTGFLNTAQAMQQRRDHTSDRDRRPRGGRGRGGPRGGPRGGRGGPRGGRRPNEDRQEAPAAPADEEGRKTRGTPRDRRPGNVQHQRDTGANRGPRGGQPRNNNLNIKNFPSLH
ncbi:hypothetical protein TRFO_14798 [Tritrichomonas foetus]|uniref:Hyaluronan/mRNA-binding protein domain-containing protein n=1 Tax=Tritrichomonas foetus TaxID=1144522 RepID=A0A1J4KVB6_9EUKA|nr:hypothetical protein TRFO_14798 [Tritrichomonas foetus]|eukprot:OHT14840.1 hypothetical protein TRFO_14798 [Tritrichomonas foetus]